MFTVKFVGGAKKSFPAEYLNIDQPDMTIQELITLLPDLKPADTPNLDTDNVLIAINGADSSAMDGRSTKIREDDIVSIIPLIHGGASRRITFELSKKIIQAVQIKGQKSTTVKFIDELRQRHPRVRLQAVSSDYILNRYHLKKIISLSLESEKNGILLSKKLEIDILMRFALTAQISSAIKSAGIKPKTNFTIIAIGSKRYLDSLYRELMPLSTIMTLNNSKSLRRHFKITKRHIDSVHSKDPLADILVEKAAVLF